LKWHYCTKSCRKNPYRLWERLH